jgi:DNA-nicking Smr family endonuclease
LRRTTKEERELFRAAALSATPVKLVRAAPKKRRHKEPAHRKPRRVDVEPADAADTKPGKRHATKEERELFLAIISDQPPVKKPAPPKHPAVVTKRTAPKTPTGLDGTTKRKLTRGEIAPTAKLDLHGMTEAAAHRALSAFVLAAHRRGDRLALIVTGKGGADPHKGRGVLKAMVPRWLEEAPMAKVIAEKRWAHIRHGGEGALYVYLRKPKA